MQVLEDMQTDKYFHLFIHQFIMFMYSLAISLARAWTINDTKAINGSPNLSGTNMKNA